MNNKQLIKVPIVLSLIMLLLAILPVWPYGYYTLLRLVVCGTAIYLVWFSKAINKQAWMWVMGFIVLLFNPLIPIRLGKEMWVFIDLVIAVIFIIYLFKLRNRKTKNE